MAPTFDELELLDRVDNDLEFLAETVDMLAGDGLRLMADIRAALAGADAGALARSAHALKGMISNFCAPSAHAAALEVEQIGKSGDLSSASPAADRLEQSIERLLAELRRFLEEKRV